MISLPFKVYCDQCNEASSTEQCLVDPILLVVPKKDMKIVRRFLAFEYPEELKPKGWFMLEIDSTIKLYCPACKEKFANEKEDEG